MPRSLYTPPARLQPRNLQPVQDVPPAGLRPNAEPVELKEPEPGPELAATAEELALIRALRDNRERFIFQGGSPYALQIAQAVLNGMDLKAALRAAKPGHNLV